MIRYILSMDNFVALKIYNLFGKEIEELVSEKQPAGEYEVRWNPVGLVLKLINSVTYYYAAFVKCNSN